MKNRISSIDIVRGLVMVIMVIDHTRDLFHETSLTQQPTDLATTTIPLFFTRWITHLCAPTFVFLSGVSAWLSLQNKSSIKAHRRFLLSRGIWLIILELTLVNFGIWFDIHFSVILIQVIFAIGFGFVILSLLLSLRSITILITGIAIMVLSGLLPLLALPQQNTVTTILNVLFQPAFIPLSEKHNVIYGYPPLPWLAIMLAGFGSAPVFVKEAAIVRKICIQAGIALIILFMVLRTINIYGDATPWSWQKNSVFSFISFLNVTKYPPSLQYTVLFLGFMFLLLAVFTNKQNRFSDILAVYGKVPLFFYLVHWYLIHTTLIAVILANGFSAGDLVFGFNFARPQAFKGFSLPVVYGVWLLAILALYPLCKWYGRYKAAHRTNKWLSYL
jgi:uncharacterized membrane protein